MISYTDFFNTTLSKYKEKLHNDSSFFNGRVDQEAMGFMVAVNSFREELLFPSFIPPKNSENISSLPTTSGSYNDSDIGKWLSDIDKIARTQAKKHRSTNVSNEEIANMVFQKNNISSQVANKHSLCTSLLSLFVIILTFCTLSWLGMSIYYCICAIFPKSFRSILQNPIFFNFSVVLPLIFSFRFLRLPINPSSKFFAKSANLFIVLTIIAYIYLTFFDLFSDPTSKMNVFLAITILLIFVTRSLLLNTDVTSKELQLGITRTKILLEVLSAELAFTSTILFIEPVTIFATNHMYLFALWFAFIFIVASVLSNIGHTLFDKALLSLESLAKDE